MLYANSLKELLLLLHLSKSIFSSSFYQRVFFCQFVDIKVMGLVAKYYLLAAETSLDSIFFFFFLHKIKISKQHRIFIH